MTNFLDNLYPKPIAIKRVINTAARVKKNSALINKCIINVTVKAGIAIITAKRLLIA